VYFSRPLKQRDQGKFTAFLPLLPDIFMAYLVIDGFTEKTG
jgi:hypothetical protein